VKKKLSILYSEPKLVRSSKVVRVYKKWTQFGRTPAALHRSHPQGAHLTEFVVIGHDVRRESMGSAANHASSRQAEHVDSSSTTACRRSFASFAECKGTLNPDCVR